MASIKYKDGNEYKDIVVKVGDTLPIGTEVDYDGAEVPSGWQQVENVLWENTSPTTAIESGAEFSLSSSDYDYYSIIYNLSTSGTNISFNTEKIPKGQGTVLSIITSGASNFSGLQRNINYTSDTKLTSGVPYSFNNSSRSVDNTALIPVKIIGYKKQIKKIAPVTPANGNIENSYGSSQTNTYSQEYINGTELFYNASGVNTDFTLNDYITNYRYLEIIVLNANQGNNYQMFKFPVNNGVRYTLPCQSVGTNTRFYIETTQYTLTDKSATFRFSTTLEINAGVLTHSAGNTNKVVRVVGYK